VLENNFCVSNPLEKEKLPMYQSIGYSGIDRFEGWFECIDSACFVADSPASLEHFLEGLHFGSPPCAYKATPVTLQKLLDDFGRSLGEYVFEAHAFALFETQAQAMGVAYEVEPDDWSTCFLVTDLCKAS
jgi:hypothetical protein